VVGIILGRLTVRCKKLRQLLDLKLIAQARLSALPEVQKLVKLNSTINLIIKVALTVFPTDSLLLNLPRHLDLLAISYMYRLVIQRVLDIAIRLHRHPIKGLLIVNLILTRSHMPNSSWL
jgi:hypothetical protein